MKRSFLMAAMLVLGAVVLAAPAEAKRLGGGKSVGAQRETVTQRQATPPATGAPQAGAPATAAAAPAAAAGAAAPAAGASRWLGPIAGIAAGLGLAALLSHFGLGEGFASVLLILLVVGVAVFMLRLLLRRNQPVEARSMAYAGPAPAAHGLHTPHGYETQPAPQLSGVERFGSRQGVPEPAPTVPEGFDVEQFLKHAKLNFTSMQQAFDRADLLALKDLTTPEMLQEVKRDLDARGDTGNETQVLKLDAHIVEVVQEANVAWASVRFTGLVRERPEEPATSFDEVWNLRKDLAAGEGWLLAGIQQLN